jgi:hypothetical protein
MARGWESKTVEDQIQEAEAKAVPDQKQKAHSTPEKMEANRRREVLLLSRARVQSDLDASRNPRYQEQLKRALADIDGQLAALGDPSAPDGAGRSS